MNPKIAIIGAGNMGGAVYRGLKAVMPEKDLFLCNRSPEKLRAFSPLHCSGDANEAIAFADIVIVAVKPQSFDELAASLTTPFKNKIVLSIMAGITIEKMQTKLGAKKVIRSLPNLGTQIKMGMTPWVASPEVSPEEKKTIKRIFASLGKELEMPEEDWIKGAGAMTASGPAYFFYLCELLAEKAKSMGFKDDDALAMAEQTFIGSAKLLEANEKSAGEWRAAVTSKKGITEAALNHLKTHHWDEIFWDAIEAARKRTEELNQTSL